MRGLLVQVSLRHLSVAPTNVVYIAEHRSPVICIYDVGDMRQLESVQSVDDAIDDAIDDARWLGSVHIGGVTLNAHAGSMQVEGGVVQKEYVHRGV
jgi:hypothetical protein